MTDATREAASELVPLVVGIGSFGSQALRQLPEALVISPAERVVLVDEHDLPRVLAAHHDMALIVGDGRDAITANAMLKSANEAAERGALTFIVSPLGSSALWHDVSRLHACLLEVGDESQAARAVAGPINCLLYHGIVGIDFAGFRESFEGRCRGTSVHVAASGPRRAADATRACWGLARHRLDLSTRSLRVSYVITAGPTMRLQEANVVGALAGREVHEDASVIWSMCVDERMPDFAVTLIAVTDL